MALLSSQERWLPRDLFVVFCFKMGGYRDDTEDFPDTCTADSQKMTVTVFSKANCSWTQGKKVLYNKSGKALLKLEVVEYVSSEISKTPSEKPHEP